MGIAAFRNSKEKKKEKEGVLALPNDILTKLFLNLPFKSMLRFRLVCRKFYYSSIAAYTITENPMLATWLSPAENAMNGMRNFLDSFKNKDPSIVEDPNRYFELVQAFRRANRPLFEFDYGPYLHVDLGGLPERTCGITMFYDWTKLLARKGCELDFSAIPPQMHFESRMAKILYGEPIFLEDFRVEKYSSIEIQHLLVCCVFVDNAHEMENLLRHSKNRELAKQHEKMMQYTDYLLKQYAYRQPVRCTTVFLTISRMNSHTPFLLDEVGTFPKDKIPHCANASPLVKKNKPSDRENLRCEIIAHINKLSDVWNKNELGIFSVFYWKYFARNHILALIVTTVFFVFCFYYQALVIQIFADTFHDWPEISWNLIESAIVYWLYVWKLFYNYTKLFYNLIVLLYNEIAMIVSCFL